MTRGADPGDRLAELGGIELAEAIVASSVDGYFVLDRASRYVLWNPAMERFTGKTAADVLGRHILDVFPFLREHGLDNAIHRVFRGEVVTTEGVPHVDRDGTRRVYDRLYLPLRGSSGAVIGLIGIVRDATRRYAAQDALRTSEVKLLMAAEATGIGLWTWDRGSNHITWDDATRRLYGLDPGEVPKGREAYVHLIHPDDRERFIDTVTRGEADGAWEHEYRVVHKDGTVRWLSTRGRLERDERGGIVFGAVYDCTQRRAAEEQRRTAQRLELVGQLTAGIAHNFNNTLMGLLPNLQLATRSAPPELLPLLRAAEHAARRAGDIVHELMTYAGRSRTTPRVVVPIAPLIEQTAAFCRTTFDRRIAIEVVARDPGVAEVDASQIEQVILNLMINARDALADDAIVAPRIAIACERVTGTPELEGRDGAWVAVRVSDNGCGMDAATLARIYEPFFTTKPIGKGTGLGLATTHDTVRNHGGFIACRSQLGEGTTFSLFIPAGVAPDVAAALRGARIRVVDDDAAARAATVRVLEADGFRVIAAATGEEALALASDVDLVLLDVAMPRLSGPEVRATLKQRVPRLPIIFVTGHAFVSEHGDVVLVKPVAAEVLVSTVARVLGAASGQGPTASGHDLRRASGRGPTASGRKVRRRRGRVRRRRGGVRGRRGRVEQRSGGVELRSGGVEQRSGGVELRSGGVEQRSGGVETRVGSSNARVGSRSAPVGSSKPGIFGCASGLDRVSSSFHRRLGILVCNHDRDRGLRLDAAARELLGHDRRAHQHRRREVREGHATDDRHDGVDLLRRLERERDRGQHRARRAGEHRGHADQRADAGRCRTPARGTRGPSR